ncbi:MAG: hypothetical protein JXA03_10475 [Bacteroidales bacterium]|nr:hypothetical protein [Bacteroidales bacterium]
MDYLHPQIGRFSDQKNYGYSVRCVQGSYSPNQPPNPPSDPTPPDNATNLPLSTQLSWTCTDPENDPLTYDVCFGTTNPPPSIATGQSATTCDPGILDNGATYYWKIVAHDDHSHTTEGAVWSFSTLSEWACGLDLLDNRDGQLYSTVQIGSQCWMAENLNIGTMINGTSYQTNNGIIEKYCYINSPAYCDEYGGLYWWNEMMEYSAIPGIQGICPDSWHLPTDTEWCTLEQELDSTITCSSTSWRGVDGGGKLKEAGTTHWQSPNTGATNSSGFTALPGGLHMTVGSNFFDLTKKGYWWSSSESGSAEAWSRRLGYSNAQVYRNIDSKYICGFSVRCVQDSFQQNQPPNIPENSIPSK